MTRTLTPDDIDSLTKKAVSQYLEELHDPVRAIWGIPRGGMAVAYRVAHEFERRRPEWPAIVVDRPGESMWNIPGPILVVDDIADTGKTITPFGNNGCTTLVLLAKPEALATNQVDFFGEQVKQDEYINFPWDENSHTPEDIIVRLLEFLGRNPNEPALLETPRRFLEWISEFAEGQAEPKITTFEGLNYNQMIMVRDISFTSLCEHHLLPFTGVATVAYIPLKGGEVVGLSKFARIVAHKAARLQVQERLTEDIQMAMAGATQSPDIAVIIKASHSCMSMRGPRAIGHSTITSKMTGAFLNNTQTRQEFLDLSGIGR